MLEIVEEFCKAHEHTIKAAGTAGTFAAVVVSLSVAFMSRREKLTKLKADVSKRIIVHSGIPADRRPRYIGVSITNTGIMPLSIPFAFFNWKVPFVRDLLMVSPLNAFGGDEHVPRIEYPHKIEAKHSYSFLISKLMTFREETVKAIPRRNWLMDWIRFRFIRAIVVTDDGRIFKVQISKDMREEFRKMRKREAWTGEL